MSHTERVVSFLKGETYKVCSVKIWLISMHIYLVRITIQWSFHGRRKFVDGPNNWSDVHKHGSNQRKTICLQGGRYCLHLCQMAFNSVQSWLEMVGSESDGLGGGSCLQASHVWYVASFSVVACAL